jgi:hypothetical protein
MFLPLGTDNPCIYNLENEYMAWGDRSDKQRMKHTLSTIENIQLTIVMRTILQKKPLKLN